MLKIVDVVDGVFNQLKEHGLYSVHTMALHTLAIYILITKK